MVPGAGILPQRLFQGCDGSQGWQQDSSWLIWGQDQLLVLKISSRANNHSINIWFGLDFYVIFHFACVDFVPLATSEWIFVVWCVLSLPINLTVFV